MFHGERFHVKLGLDPWFVTGFCEAGASFTYSRSGRGFGLYFALKVGASDLPILQNLQSFFGGAGHIYPIGSDSDGLGKLGGPFYYRVTRVRDLALIVSHFDSHPFAGEKAKRYAIWRSMVALKQRFRRPDVQSLTVLALQLSALGRGVG